MRTERDREGYLEVEVIWEGALDEMRTFDLDGRSLDENPRAFEAWFDDLKRDALDADANVEVYVVEHGHPIELADDEECACAQYVPDCWPYWSHHRVGTDE